MEHEAELPFRRRPLILPDHPPIGVLPAFVDALARHEGEADRIGVVRARRGDGAADAARIPFLVDEAIPIDSAWFQAGGEDAAGPVRLGQDRRAARADKLPEPGVGGKLDRELAACAVGIGAARPQDDAVRLRIARCDAFGEQVAPFARLDPLRPRRSRPEQGGTHGGRAGQSGAPVDLRK